MDPREYLVKAQEAEALADSATNITRRSEWENLAREYRRMAQEVAGINSTWFANPSEA